MLGSASFANNKGAGGGLGDSPGYTLNIHVRAHVAGTDRYSLEKRCQTGQLLHFCSQHFGRRASERVVPVPSVANIVDEMSGSARLASLLACFARLGAA